MEVRKVLLVDDEQDIRTVARMSLSVVGGWDVAVAASGREALELAASEQPDVILLDAMMPEMDGPATLRALRAQPSTARIPIIFLTAKVQASEVEQFRSLGAVGVIAKPFDPMELPNHMRRAVAEVPGKAAIVSIPPASGHTSLAAPAASVLLVEDDVELRALLVPRLRERGYAVAHVSTVADARKQLELRAFTIVVAEASLSDGDGLALLDEVSAREPGTALLLMSAFLADLRALASAKSDPILASMIAKPFAPEQFLAEVRLAIDAWAAPRKGRSDPLHDAAPDLEASLDALRREYEGKLREKLQELRAALTEARASADYDTALRLSHRIHGTAGTYGFVEVSQAAATIEHALRDAVKAATPLEASRWGELDAALDRALRWLSIAPAPSAGPRERMSSTLPTVLVVDDDVDVCRGVERIGRTALFKTRSAVSADEAVARALDLPRPDGAIIKVSLRDEQAEGGFGVAIRLRALDGFESLPIAFMAADDSLATRVAAAHAGGSVFLRDATDADAVNRTVQALVEARHRGGPRVLIVDDDDSFASFIARLLAGAGIEAQCLADPLKIMATLEVARPDVLLLDVGLPHVSGLDVCRMLRGQLAWRDLPILFLSANATADVRIACFQAGGDDYVAKPILREELLARVRNRYERARLALENSERDSLTGLLLRRAFGDAFARLLAHSRRADRPLSLALLDIDHFKSVNDRHGHLVGDTVIAGLGQMLRRSLRAEDVRGRWGGEEFLVALDGLDAPTAGAVMTRMLDAYRRLSFVSASRTTFSATFSAGVSSYPDDGDSLEALLAVADRRLYAAKAAGRARVSHLG